MWFTPYISRPPLPPPPPHPQALSIPTLDLYSDHFYPVDAQRLANGAGAVAAAGKVYIAGEYGWTSGDVTGFLGTALDTPAVSLDMFWSLFPHLDTYGFVQHGDGFTVHWPGDNSGMAAFAQLSRAHNVNMTSPGAPYPPPPAPVVGVPLVTGASASTSKVAWRGAAGAAVYSLSTAPAASGPFTVACALCYSDNSTPVTSPAVASGVWVQVTAYGLQGRGPAVPSQPCQVNGSGPTACSPLP